MDTVETSVPEGDRKELLHGSAEMVALSGSLEVTDATSLELAGNYRRHAKERLARIEDKVGVRVAAVYAAWRGLRDMQNELERPWKAVVTLCGHLIGNYELAQRRAKAAAEAAVREARQTAELAAARRHAEQLQAARADAERQRLEDAAALFEAGDIDGADLALQRPPRPVAVPPPVQPAIQPPSDSAPIQRAAGTSVAVVYKARLLNLDQLIEAAAADKTLRCLLQFEPVAANSMAKAMGARMQVPGVEVFQAPAVRQR
jgi:hypothetical protein